MRFSFQSLNKFQIFCFAIILAVLVGILTSLFFIYIDRDSYSAIYLYPDRIIRSQDNATVFFEYGVASTELKTTDYSLAVTINGNVVKTKQFSLRPGEVLEESQRLDIPADITYPAKIEVDLTTKDMSDEVHFWLK